MKILTFLALIVVFLNPVYGLPLSSAHAATPSNQFSFTLSEHATTSAGVFKKDGTLVRTLWGNVPYDAGTHTATWDGTDDDRVLLPNEAYDIRVLSANMKYVWEGVIGNTSEKFTGDTIHKSFYTTGGMAIAGNSAFVSYHYNEGAPSQGRFALDRPQVKIEVSKRTGISQSTEFVATDGTNVFWAGGKEGTHFIFATRVSDNSEVGFSNGAQVHGYISGFNINGDEIYGLAVQKTAPYLFVSHAEQNRIDVVNRISGAAVRSIPISFPRHLTVDANDNLWVTSGDANVQKYTVNADGSLTPTGISLAGIAKSAALAVSPDNSTLLVADAGSHQQIKAFSNSNGSALWTLGQEGGYSKSPRVTNDKFSFDSTYIAFQPDGSFWVGDVGNYRSQHYSANRTFVDRVMYMPHSYNVFTDANDLSRVFSDHLEFKVDMSKPLGPNNGSWELANNYSYSVPDGQAFMQAMTLKNGRTYIFRTNIHDQTRNWKIYELMDDALPRDTGIEFGMGTIQIYPDGALRKVWPFVGQPMVWYKNELTGFDSQNNPLWGPNEVMASTPVITKDDPTYLGSGGTLRAAELTTSGVLIMFDGAYPGSEKYHLGGVKLGDNKWLWKTAKVTRKDYWGPYPEDGSYDIGNGVVYAGSVGLVSQRSVFWGYHGEFWKSGQVNMWNQVYDDGLMVGQFGWKDGGWGNPPGMAGNAFSATMVEDKKGNSYMYHNDESVHAGIHRWKISNHESIKEQTIPINYTSNAGGLYSEYFNGSNLDNVNVVSEGLVPTVNLTTAPSQVTDPSNFSARWKGYLKPNFSEKYSFYVTGSKGFKLWIDDVLVIDRWNNNGAVEAKSPEFDLNAAKSNLITMEMNGGTATLSWSSASQPKTIVPSSNLYPYVPIPGEGIDLMEGLPYNETVQSLYGWSRTGTDNIDLLAYSFWTVRTNYTQYDHRKPTDVSIYHHLSKDSVNIVARNLGNYSSLNNWKLSGIIDYQTNFPDALGGGNYLEVLDANDKVIARLNYGITFSETNPYNLYGNGKLIHTEAGATFLTTLWKPQLLEISGKSDGITFKYAQYDPITVGIVDPTANWRAPKTFRVYTWGANYDRKIDLSAMRFVPDTAATPDPVLSTPAAPALEADDVDNTLAASHNLGTSEILVSVNDAAFIAYSGTINVGDVARNAGYYKFKVKASSGHNESSVVQSPAFTKAADPVLTTPAVPTVAADDQANTLSASHNLGTSEILVSVNDAAFIAYSGTINVGDIARNAGYYKFKIKAAAGRNESSVAQSPAFTKSAEAVTPIAPTLIADDAADTVSASHNLGTSEILVSVNGASFSAYTGTINVGDVARSAGYYKFKTRAATGRNESPVAQSAAFTKLPVANVAPTVNITAPTNLSSFDASTTVTITANAADKDGSVAKVEFFAGSAKIGEATNSPYQFEWKNVAIGNYALTAKAIDDDGLSTVSSSVQINVVSGEPDTSCNGSGGLVWEYWKNASNGTVSSMSEKPTGTKILNGLASPINIADSYISRARGYLCAPQTGNYVFYFAADDDGSLWLSTDANPANKRKIASSDGWTLPGEYTRYAGQKSKTVALQAGHRYYIEALQNEGQGGDHMSVAWDLPNGNKEAPIAGSRLIAFNADGIPPIDTTPDDTNKAPSITLTSPTSDSTFNAITPIVINANATDSDGTIAKVEFFSNSTKIGEDTSSPYSFSWSKVPLGNYELRAKATDNSGASTLSAVVQVSVKNQSPSVTLTSPAPGTKITLPDSVTITASASDLDSGVSKVEFFSGSTKIGEDLTSPYAFDWKNVPVGNYSLSVKATDSNGLSITSSPVAISVVAAPVTSGCRDTGNIVWEYWMNSANGSAVSMSANPTGTRQLSSFASPVNFGDNYSSRARGYICPSQTGNYVFYFASDNDGSLWLSMDSNPANKRQIASVADWTWPGEYTRTPSQRSKPVFLQAGQRYYIEAIQNEGQGGDHVSVAWDLPDGTKEAPIAGGKLIPYGKIDTSRKVRK